MTSKPFSKCSADEMRRALKAKRKPTSSRPLPEEDLVLADQITEQVKSRFQKGDPIKVEVRNHVGEAVMDYKGIPLAKRRKLAEALMTETELELAARKEDRTPQA